MRFIAAICLSVIVISMLTSCSFKTIPYPYIARSEAMNATKALKRSTLMVMNNEGSPYSSVAAAAVQKYWKFTSYGFESHNELSASLRDPNFRVLAFSRSTSYEYDTGSGYGIFKPAVTDSIENAIPIAFVHLPTECKQEHKELFATLAVLRLQQQVVEMYQGFTIRIDKGSCHGTAFYKNGRKEVLQSPVYILKGLMDEDKARLVARNLGKPFEQLSFASAEEIMELIRREDVDALLIYEQSFVPDVENQGGSLESYKIYNASGKEIAIASALTAQERIGVNRTIKKRTILCAGLWLVTIGALLYSYLDMTGGL